MFYPEYSYILPVQCLRDQEGWMRWKHVHHCDCDHDTSIIRIPSLLEARSDLK